MTEIAVLRVVANGEADFWNCANIDALDDFEDEARSSPLSIWAENKLKALSLVIDNSVSVEDKAWALPLSPTVAFPLSTTVASEARAFPFSAIKALIPRKELNFMFG